MFSTFVNQLSNRLNAPLPGERAQFLMAPVGRRDNKLNEAEKYNARKSAVLILLYPHETSVNTLLIQRPVYEGVHSGQVAFPGGKFENDDIHLTNTALREANEEVGIVKEDVKILGKLTDLYIPPSNFLVSPFIGYTTYKPQFIANAYEVNKLIPTDLIELNNPTLISEQVIKHGSGYSLKTPCYIIDGLTVWGATAMMISELNAVVAEVSDGGAQSH